MIKIQELSTFLSKIDDMESLESLVASLEKHIFKQIDKQLRIEIISAKNVAMESYKDPVPTIQAEQTSAPQTVAQSKSTSEPRTIIEDESMSESEGDLESPTMATIREKRSLQKLVSRSERDVDAAKKRVRHSKLKPMESIIEEKAKGKPKEYPEIQDKIDRLVAGDRVVMKNLRLQCLSLDDFQQGFKVSIIEEYPRATFENIKLMKDENSVSVFRKFYKRIQTHMSQELINKVQRNHCYYDFCRYLDDHFPDAQKRKAYRLYLKTKFNVDMVDRMFKCAYRIGELFKIFNQGVIRCPYLFNGVLLGDVNQKVFERCRLSFAKHREEINEILRNI